MRNHIILLGSIWHSTDLGPLFWKVSSPDKTFPGEWRMIRNVQIKSKGSIVVSLTCIQLALFPLLTWFQSHLSVFSRLAKDVKSVEHLQTSHSDLQTYFLWWRIQTLLKQSVFPLGGARIPAHQTDLRTDLSLTRGNVLVLFGTALAADLSCPKDPLPDPASGTSGLRKWPMKYFVDLVWVHLFFLNSFIALYQIRVGSVFCSAKSVSWYFMESCWRFLVGYSGGCPCFSMSFAEVGGPLCAS